MSSFEKKIAESMQFLTTGQSLSVEPISKQEALKVLGKLDVGNYRFSLAKDKEKWVLRNPSSLQDTNRDWGSIYTFAYKMQDN